MPDNLIETFERRFRVGKYRVRLSADLVGNKAIGLSMEWDPDFPGGLPGKLFDIYRRRRNAAYAALAARLGAPVVMLDTDGASFMYPDGHVELMDFPPNGVA